jgi:DNA polymerase I-like protein with 3'-5' exonuclease and polymerase domains
MRIWTLDAETYYINERGGEKYSLTLKGKDRMSIVDYVTDPRWLEHGWAVLYPDGEARFIKPAHFDAVLDLIKPEDLILVHNWAFDGLALRYHYGFRHWNVIDTMLLANAVLGTRKDRGESNSLGDLAEELELPYRKGDLSPIEGKRELTEDEFDYLALYAKGDVRITKEIYEILMPQLRNPSSEIWLMQHSLNLFINRPIKVDAGRVEKATADLQAWNQRALDKVMTPTIEMHEHGGIYEYEEPFEVAPLITDVTQLSSEKQFAEILEPILKEHDMKLPKKMTEQKIKKPTKPKRKRPAPDNNNWEVRDRMTVKQLEAEAQWINYDQEMQAFVPGTFKTMIPALAKADFGFQKLLVCGVPLVEDLCAARVALKSGRTVSARLKGIQADVAHMSLVYHGAGTGRWTGGGNGWNPQNIPSPSRAANEEAARMSVALRSCLVPKPGHKFVHVDLAQAEARVVAWMAGQWDLVQQFAAGEDVYSTFISSVLRTEVVKPADDDNSPEAAKMKALRAVGKEAILGLGFGMGKYKFHARLRAIPAVRTLLGAQLDDDYAMRLVDAYRKKYPLVPAYWKEMERCFHGARRGANMQLGAMRFEPRHNGESVWMIYPNGRRVPYCKLRMTEGQSDKMQWIAGSGKKIYGGLLTENAVQGTARDILAEGIYKCEAAGYRVMLTVHDSIILEVPVDQAETALDFAINILRKPPTWAPLLALDAEGHISGDFN